MPTLNPCPHNSVENSADFQGTGTPVINKALRIFGLICYLFHKLTSLNAYKVEKFIKKKVY